MKFGAHLSMSKGPKGLLVQADELGADAIQIFARNPRGRGEAKVTEPEAKEFRAELAKRKATLVIHAPYYVNIGSGTPKNQQISRNVTKLDLEKGDLIGADYLVVHLGGSGDGFSVEDGTKYAIKTVKDILKSTKAKTMLLLETSAGTSRVGSRFEQLRQILDGIKSPKRVGVCLDTCHVFTAGYDVRGKKMKAVINEFDRVVGLKHLKVIHCNDTLSDLGGGLDRHWHIDQGQIGREAFKLLLQDKRLKDLPFILETPKEDKTGKMKNPDRTNLALLKKLAKA